MSRAGRNARVTGPTRPFGGKCGTTRTGFYCSRTCRNGGSSSSRRNSTTDGKGHTRGSTQTGKSRSTSDWPTATARAARWCSGSSVVGRTRGSTGSRSTTLTSYSIVSRNTYRSWSSYTRAGDGGGGVSLGPSGNAATTATPCRSRFGGTGKGSSCVRKGTFFSSSTGTPRTVRPPLGTSCFGARYRVFTTSGRIAAACCSFCRKRAS